MYSFNAHILLDLEFKDLSFGKYLSLTQYFVTCMCQWDRQWSERLFLHAPWQTGDHIVKKSCQESPLNFLVKRWSSYDISCNEVAPICCSYELSPYWTNCLGMEQADLVCKQVQFYSLFVCVGTKDQINARVDCETVLRSYWRRFFRQWF